jgi:hypothetical protein
MTTCADIPPIINNSQVRILMSFINKKNTLSMKILIFQKICNGTIDLLIQNLSVGSSKKKTISDNSSLFQTSTIHDRLSSSSISSISYNNGISKSCVNWNYYYTKCRPSDKNPFKGAISFDNIGLAWVAIFQIISLESWVTIMYYIQDAHSFWNWIYFVVLIVVSINF